MHQQQPNNNNMIIGLVVLTLAVVFCRPVQASTPSKAITEYCGDVAQLGAVAIGLKVSGMPEDVIKEGLTQMDASIILPELRTGIITKVFSLTDDKDLEGLDSELYEMVYMQGVYNDIFNGCTRNPERKES